MSIVVSTIRQPSALGHSKHSNWRPMHAMHNSLSSYSYISLSFSFARKEFSPTLLFLSRVFSWVSLCSSSLIFRSFFVFNLKQHKTQVLRGSIPTMFETSSFSCFLCFIILQPQGDLRNHRFNFGKLKQI
uniref:Uncharacterized protein n=1 Tax=Rhizophora mucronata TaxID=61149 RepID=A0A2P2JEF4_RHIMU